MLLILRGVVLASWRVRTWNLSFIWINRHKSSKVIFGSLFNPAMRILPAGGVAVEVSADGKQYTRIAEKALKHDYPETGRIAFTDSIEFEPAQATFLKVKIKNGGTLRNGVNFEKNNGPEVIPAELWIDEIEAY